MNDSLAVVKKAVKALEDKKGDQVTILDVRELSGITDYFVLVSGFNSPHLKAMIGEVRGVLKKGGGQVRVSGTPESGWIVADAFDVMIHVMTREARQYYDLDNLWKDAPRISI